MQNPDFTTFIEVNAPAGTVFNAVNNPRGWWSEEIEGVTDQLNGVFDYHFQDDHIAKMKIIEWVPDQKLVWLVLDNYFKFTKDKSEWNNTKIIFDISAKGNQTLLRFTHEGLVPDYECYEVCRNAWTNYITNSLRSLITTGTGQPNKKEVPA